MGYNFKRSDRVADLIKEEIASMILHGGIKDPRIGFVTITSVKMSPDLKEAKVYFSQIGTEDEKKQSIEGLNNASGFVRRHIAKVLTLKYIPMVSFHYDNSLEYAEHMEKIFRELKKDGQG